MIEKDHLRFNLLMQAIRG